MKSLDKTFERSISNSFADFITRVIMKRAKKGGITLSRTDVKELRRQAHNDILGLESSGLLPAQIALTEEDVRQVKEWSSAFDREMPQIIARSAQSASRIIFRSLKKTWAEELVWQKTFRTSFERRLRRVWKRPLELLQMLIVMCLEIGDEVNTKLRSGA
jgi:hypothetical protein